MRDHVLLRKDGQGSRSCWAGPAFRWPVFDLNRFGPLVDVDTDVGVDDIDLDVNVNVDINILVEFFVNVRIDVDAVVDVGADVEYDFTGTMVFMWSTYGYQYWIYSLHPASAFKYFAQHNQVIEDGRVFPPTPWLGFYF